MSSEIKHVWFDFSQTIAVENKEIHDKIKYETYASVVGRPVDETLKAEYEALYKEKLSNSGVFTSLGLDSGFWSNHYSAIDPKALLRLAEPTIPEVLSRLRERVPISMWSNIRAEKILPALGIDPAWFTFFLSPDEVKNPKPALDGFKLLMEKSNLPAENILFVGDSVEKEMIPAKSLGIQTCLMWKTAPEPDFCFKSFNELLELIRRDV
jgi:HAD superfamily hydrolase (TIGR01509 family)